MTIIVFSLYFVTIIVLTFYGTRKARVSQASNFSEDFFVGGRKMGPLALSILIAAGACSTGTFVGCPGLGAAFGPGYVLLFVMGQISMSLFILGILGKKMNIIGRRTKSETYIDIFRYRYSNWKPLIFTLAFVILLLLVTATTAEFIGGSRVIQTMTGIPFMYSLVAFGIIITLYTALGGLKGVSIVGILQGFLMTLATFILVFGYLVHFGGLRPMFEQVGQIDPKLLTPNFGGKFSLLQMFDLRITYSLGLIGLPWAVQSNLSYKDTKSMKQAIVISIILICLWTLLLAVFGGVAGRINTPDLPISDFALPNLAIDILPDYLTGIVLAGIAAAGQSTIAALFILASGSIVINVFKAYVNPSLQDHETRRLTVIVLFVIGLVVILLSANPPSTLQVFVTFAAGGSASALIPGIVLGLYWPRTTKQGALAGVLSGMLCYSWLTLSPPTTFLGQIPFLVSLPVSLVLTVLISLVTEKPSRETVELYFGER